MNVASCLISRNLAFMDFHHNSNEIETYFYPPFKRPLTFLVNIHGFYLSLYFFVWLLDWFGFLLTWGNGEQGWMVTKIRQKFKFTRSNAMLAVDCEMVLCEDGTEGLVRVCVVDRNLQVLMELFKPYMLYKHLFSHYITNLL